MKRTKHLAASLLTVSILADPSVGLAADPKTEVKPYPLTTCVVSGEKLGEMGKPYVFTNGNHEIKFCCKSCLKDFNKDPGKYIKKIDEAAAKPRK